MIDRYTRETMRQIWSEELKFRTYLTIEILNAEAWHEKGLIKKSEFEAIQKNANFTLERITELESQTNHDVIAFTRAVSESLGPEGRFIHYGLTSTDVVDTALGARLKMANRILIDDLKEFMEVLKEKAYKYKNTPVIGRTHGMHADITSFGLKFALWYDDMRRNLDRLTNACKNVEVGKLSGAVGNYAFADPEVEKFVCERLGLEVPAISTQVLERDRHAEYISVLALIGTSLEKIATEIRHLQRSEVGEVEEAFKSTQKGSSAMPHKHNPIASENICGLARVLRGYVIPAYEDVSLWH
ncbi:MAG: adenylosuccinate lyase, partial [Bacilli bacterium]|nr:adenylosuccinate lyase [Bacilli bacterium]MBN2696949.1 adenylosuccinate lyase [Bacilli bacterium]